MPMYICSTAASSLCCVCKLATCESDKKKRKIHCERGIQQVIN